MNTPIDTTPSSTLDSLKTAVLRTIEDLGVIGDTLAGAYDFPDDHQVMATIDRLGYQLKVILAEHVPGVEVPADGLLMWEQKQALNRYDNGKPVQIHRTIGNGHVGYDIWPRLDTQIDALRTATAAADIAQRMEAGGDAS